MDIIISLLVDGEFIGTEGRREKGGVVKGREEGGGIGGRRKEVEGGKKAGGEGRREGEGREGGGGRKEGGRGGREGEGRKGGEGRKEGGREGEGRGGAGLINLVLCNLQILMCSW
jgi:hypothetical protein